MENTQEHILDALKVKLKFNILRRNLFLVSSIYVQM